MTYNIPQNNPKASYQAHQNEIDSAIRQVIDSGWYILGEQEKVFESEFASYIGADHAIGVASGTDALCLALKACGLGPDDAVITVSHSATATAAAIELTGALPVFVDIDPDHFTLDPACLEKTIKAFAGKYRVKAIIPVHIYGHPADMPAIMDIARRNDIYVIEDCAQSHGASIDGKKTGVWGHISAFSFYPTKNLGALGDAGAVVTNDPVLAERVRMLREYGWQKRYISTMPGTNSRLDELQAAILRIKLRYLNEDNSRRREIADIYNSLLKGSSVIIPGRRTGAEHVYHQYVIRSSQRDRLRETLKKFNIDTAIHYPLPIHLQPAYVRRAVIGIGGLSYTENVCKEILSLPLYPQLSNEEVNFIGKTIVEESAKIKTE